MSIINDDVYDITIIGGGPSGLFAAFYAGMRQARCKIIESMPYLGGQLAALYPEKYIYDVAGFPKIRAQELIDRLQAQLDLFPVTIHTNETVFDVHRNTANIFQLRTQTQTHYTKSIIITAGCGAFEPRKLQLENAEHFEGENLHYFVDDIQGLSNKRVLICGGGDSAVDWALMLAPIAKEVILVHRREHFRAHEHSVKQLSETNVGIKTPYQINQLTGNNRIAY